MAGTVQFKIRNRLSFTAKIYDIFVERKAVKLSETDLAIHS